MSRLVLTPLVILGISLLVIIHEFGHYIVARAFGMRVVTFSVGFGPALWRWRPKGSETVFQVAVIPVLAYVQIAGMNPREPRDARDRGSYQNATPLARFLTIAAGPLANYIAAGMALFIVLAAGGERTHTVPQIGAVMPASPAAIAGIQPNDLVVSMGTTPIRTWDDLIVATSGSGGRTLPLVVERDHRRVPLVVTPRMNTEFHRFTLGVESKPTFRHVALSYAAGTAIVRPAEATIEILAQIRDMIRHRAPVSVVGPIGIVRETVHQAQQGWRQGFEMVGLISLELFIFNLLPIPALDGGRLMVLGYEIATRRRPDPNIEARVLTWSLMLMLGLFLIISSKEVWGVISGLFHG